MIKQSHEHAGKQKFVLARWFDAGFAAFENSYAWVVRKALRWPWMTVFMALLTLAASVVVVSQVPGEFIPAEDRSEFAVTIEMPTGTSLEATSEVAEAVAADIRDNLPGVRGTFTTIGSGTSTVNIARIDV